MQNSQQNILSTSSSEKYKKSNIKMNSKSQDKVSSKKAKIKFRNVIQYYNSENNSLLKSSNSNLISRQSIIVKTNSLKDYKSKISLTEGDKRKIKSIIKVFKNHKVLTERLLKKEKNLALNSVNNSNYSFLLSQNKDKISKNKSKKLLYRNQYNDCSSYMINKFNNKTFGILDPPNRDPMYSTNIIYFRKQLINNFNEYNKNLEYARKKYNDAMKVGEINEQKNIKIAFDLEKKFYQNKYNFLKNLNIKDINQHILDKLKQLHGAFRNSYINRNKDIVMKKSLQKHKTTIVRGSIIEEENKDNKKIDLKHAFSNVQNIDSNNKYIRLNKSHKTEIKNENSEKKLLRVKKEHNDKEQKKIMQRSSDYVNSIYEINDYPYEEFDALYSKGRQGLISHHNLSRAIKINTINKYIYDLEDDDLLLHDIKKLKKEITKVQIECNKNNYRTNYNMSFLRKNLKKETIRKFNNIKDSRFGFPV